jgi:CelD/BcsL family acetyltransferase involved in cellulose biosynthesis
MFERQIESVLGAAPEPFDDALDASRRDAGPLQVDLSLHDDLASIEKEWRAFEERADCTVFQTFDWLSAWLRNLGVREGVKPVIVIGRYQGAVLFVMPFALDAGGRTLRWLGSSLCNYNGPLLASDFSKRVDAAQFAKLWVEVRRLLRSRLGYDLIDLEKMPAEIGRQANPFLSLRVSRHINSAYLTTLAPDWETYYASKRSSATRRKDRKKQRGLAERGEVRIVTAVSREEISRTLDALIEEKTASYAKLGVDNLFERPGYRDFYLDLATGSQSGRLVHLSRMDVGAETAAANYGLIFRGTYIYLLAGYNDGEVGRLGPGYLHLLETFQHAIGQGLNVFDFTIGDEPYKRDWHDTEMHLYDHVSPASLRGVAMAVSIMIKRMIKRQVRQNPRVWAVVRKARSLMGSLRR